MSRWIRRLVAAGRLSVAEAQAAAVDDGRWWGERVEAAIDADALARFLAAAGGMPYVEPDAPGERLRGLLGDHFPHVVPLRLEGRTLHVAIRDPSDIVLIDRLGLWTGFAIAPAVASWRRIARALEPPPAPPPSEPPSPPRRWRLFLAADPARTAAEVVFGAAGLEVRTEDDAMRALLRFLVADPFGARFEDDRPARARMWATLATFHHHYPAWRAEPVE